MDMTNVPTLKTKLVNNRILLKLTLVLFAHNLLERLPELLLLRSGSYWLTSFFYTYKSSSSVRKTMVQYNLRFIPLYVQ